MIPAVPDFGIGPAPEPGRVDQVSAGVLRLTAPNPGLMTGPGTNTYLVGSAEPVVIDPGPANPMHTAEAMPIESRSIRLGDGLPPGSFGAARIAYVEGVMHRSGSSGLTRWD